MKIDVEENLINPPERTNSISIDNEIENLLGQNIRTDIRYRIIKRNGIRTKMINRVYILLKPTIIQNTIEFMIEIDNKYQHNFIPNKILKKRIYVLYVKNLKKIIWIIIKK